jgi:hypothetical protein
MLSSLLPHQQLAPTATTVTTNKRKQAAPRPKLAKVCNRCDFSSNEPVEFIEHMRVEHNVDEIYPCDFCVFYTDSLRNYQGHMKEHSEK